MKTLATISVFLIAILFSGCEQTKKVIEVATNVQLSGSYTVSDLNGKNISGTAPTFTMNALDNSFSGTTGCNSVFGSYALNGNILNFGDLAVSEKYCTDEKVRMVESQFLEALNNSGSFQIQESVLTIYSKENNAILLTATKDKKGASNDD